jgi:hypothetical protein
MRKHTRKLPLDVRASRRLYSAGLRVARAAKDAIERQSRNKERQLERWQTALEGMQRATFAAADVVFGEAVEIDSE